MTPMDTRLPSEQRAALTAEIAQAQERLRFADAIQRVLGKTTTDLFFVDVRDTKEPTRCAGTLVQAAHGTIERAQLAHLADHLAGAAEHDLREAAGKLYTLLTDEGRQA